MAWGGVAGVLAVQVCGGEEPYDSEPAPVNVVPPAPVSVPDPLPVEDDDDEPIYQAPVNQPQNNTPSRPPPARSGTLTVKFTGRDTGFATLKCPSASPARSGIQGGQATFANTPAESCELSVTGLMGGTTIRAGRRTINCSATGSLSCN